MKDVIDFIYDDIYSQTAITKLFDGFDITIRDQGTTIYLEYEESLSIFYVDTPEFVTYKIIKELVNGTSY